MNYSKKKFFHILTKSKIHPAIKLNPPNGVIAPNALIPVIASKYKLPENKIIPVERRIAGHLNDTEGMETASTPNSNNPKAW